MSSDGAFQPRRSFHDLQRAGARGRAQTQTQTQADTDATPCGPKSTLEERCWASAPPIGAGRCSLSRDPGFLQQISRMISSRLSNSVASAAAAMMGDDNAVGVDGLQAFDDGNATPSSSTSSSSSSLMQPLLGPDSFEEAAAATGCPTAGTVTSVHPASS